MNLGAENSPWTGDRVELLKKLWLVDRLSAAQIVAEMNCGLTRSGVLGKVNRLGLERRYAPKPVHLRKEISNPGLMSDVRAKRIIAAKKAPPLQPDHPLTAKHKPKTGAHHGGDHGQGTLKSIRHAPGADELVDEAQATDLPNEQTDTAVSFFERQPHQCAHPIGNPQDLETFRYCGAPREGTHSYCSKHCRMNYGAQPRVQHSFAQRQKINAASRLTHAHR
jgi:hypothetical protein